MKKYLMTGIAAVAMCAAFTSCSHDVEPVSQEDLNKFEAQKIVENYNQAFIKAFGQPAANQEWGFGGYAAGTRADNEHANTGGNIWYKTYERPYNIGLTGDEIAELKALLTKTPGTYNTEVFPYENYYVEQIYKGGSDLREGQAAESDYAYDNNGNRTNTQVTGSGQMDWLKARAGNEYAHINNFNYGNNTTEMVDEGNGTRYIGITLMENMSLDGITATNQFGFSESWGTENGKFYNNYLIVEYKGEWYVGFDFEAHKSTATHNNGEAMQVERNWAFTDWIVRISPAEAKVVDPNNVCIIAEDLSADGDTDFDWNDVVFTVEYTSDTKAKVTLYAAGGTLPLTVAGREVHAAFGYEQPNEKGLYKMINTGAKADVNDVAPVVIFEDLTVDKSKRGKDIIIKVDKGTKNAEGAHVANWVELTATGGKPAAKVCVGVDYATRHMWCDERQSIKTVYPKFSQWVAESPTLLWWRN